MGQSLPIDIQENKFIEFHHAEKGADMGCKGGMYLLLIFGNSVPAGNRRSGTTIGAGDIRVDAASGLLMPSRENG